MFSWMLGWEYAALSAAAETLEFEGIGGLVQGAIVLAPIVSDVSSGERQQPSAAHMVNAAHAHLIVMDVVISTCI